MLIVVGVIAAIAIPTYHRVVRRAREEVSELSVAGVVAEAWVLAVHDNGRYSVDVLAAAASDVAPEGSWSVDASDDAASGGYGQLAVELTDDGNGVAAAMRDRDGGCSYLLAWRGDPPSVWSVAAETGSECTAAEALWGPPDPPGGPLVTVP